MPGGLGNKVEEIIARAEQCPASSSRKRDALLDCVGRNADVLIGQAAGGTGPLGGLVIANVQLPGLAVALAGALQTVIQNGRRFQGILSNADYTNPATIAIFLAYADKVLHENPNQASPTQFVMSATYLTSSSTPSTSCPPDNCTPNCDNCCGDDGSQHCKGIVSAGGLWQGCDCFSCPDYSYRPFASNQDFLAAQKALMNLPDISSTSTAPAPAATCTTTTSLLWANNGNNFDTMSFAVSGKYTGVSDPLAGQKVWDDNDAASANPKLGSKPGPLPAFLIETYDHDQDWVQYDYGSQSWASSDKQCQDSGWWSLPAIQSFPHRVINCTFTC